MALLQPTFRLQIGALASTSGRPVGGPVRLHVTRTMGGLAESLDVALTTREGVMPGDKARAELGFDGEREAVFTGQVVEVVSTLAGGVRVLALGGMDRLLRLRLARSWEDRDAGVVVRDLAGAAGMDVGQVDAGPTLPRYAVDMKLDAAAHLRRLAQRLGFELYTHRDGTLQFRALGAAARLDGPAGFGGIGGAGAALVAAAAGLPGGPRADFEMGRNLIEACASRRADGVTQVRVGGEGPASSHGSSSSWWLSPGSDSGQGGAGRGDAGVLLLDAAARTQDLARRFAEGQLVTGQRARHRVRLRSVGRATLELGDALRVGAARDGLINASGYVCALEHRLGPDTGFITDITLQAGGDA